MEDYRVNKRVRLASRMVLAGAIWYWFGSLFLIVIGMITPIEININGVYTRAYLWELIAYPGPLSLWLAFASFPFLLGISGIAIRKKLRKQPTAKQGIVLLVLGIATVWAGAGILYIIAGIQTLLAIDSHTRYHSIH